MSDKETYYLFAGAGPAGDAGAEPFWETDVEGLWLRLTADLTALYGEPHEVTRSSFQLYSHFRSEGEFFAQLIVDWSTSDWPRTMVPASIRIAHAEDTAAFSHALYDRLDRLGYCLALEENDTAYIRCNFTSPSEF
ncbi:hypothetical protein OG625_14465 [Streptomyces sp. NBC_01351]|uniref:hypothetical protein n=1 Tax=Streptomyces sp. NBC_01351 TaxID=2903833 RepID=UPI002E36F7FB|nr:hypothetical protein [Streptomyces sp. NBC_01351]